MSMTDPIADLLTRLRNASANGSKTVTVPFSGLKQQILRVLKEQGYIADFLPEMEGAHGALRIQLKYGPDGQQIIQHIQRVSTPGRRIYRRVSQLSEVLDGLGIAIVSTSRGIMSSSDAKKIGVGGEVLCEVW